MTTSRPHPNLNVPCDKCGRTFCCPMHMGRHRSSTHGVEPLKATRKRDFEVGDALIEAFRRLLKEAETLHELIRKQQEHSDELATGLRETTAEIRRLDRENAELRGRVLHYRQQRDDVRKEVAVEPLATRLTPEELAYLQRIAAGEEGR